MTAPVHHLPTSLARPGRSDEVVGSDGLILAVSQPTRSTLVVRVIGEVDLATADRWARTLDRSISAVADEIRHRGHATGARGRVVCDLDGVTLLAAAGLRVLVEATDRAAAEGVALVVRTTEGPARRTLRRTGVDVHVAVHEDLATALDLDGPPEVVPPPVARPA